MSENKQDRILPIREVEPENGHRRFVPDGPPSHIDYVLQTPQTIEDATVPTSTILQIAKLLGLEPKTVTRIELTPHQVTVEAVVHDEKGLPVKREGTEGVYEGRKHVRIVI